MTSAENLQTMIILGAGASAAEDAPPGGEDLAEEDAEPELVTDCAPGSTAPCDDGDECTRNDRCDASGACVLSRSDGSSGVPPSGSIVFDSPVPPLGSVSLRK